MKQTRPIKYTDLDADNTIESLMMRHSGKQPFIYWVVLLGLVAAIIALPIVKIQVSVSAPGIITSKNERIAIVSPSDGYVKENLSSDNLPVQSGDTLIILESKVLSEKISLNSTQREEIENALVDIAMLLKTIEKTDNDETLSLNTAAIGIFGTAQYLGQYELLCTQLLNNDMQFARNTREHNRVRALHVRGLTSDRDLDEAKYACDLNKAERQQLIRGNMSNWRTNQLSLQNALTQNMGEAAQLSKQAEYYTIKAPANGVLMGFNNLSPGTFIPASTHVGDVSPREDLLVDAHVAPRDIGFVRIGQRALMQVDSFPYTEWGALYGEVVAISPDIIQVGQTVVFKVTLNMADTTLESVALGKVNVGKGMTLRIQFLMQPRTLLQLLYQKTSEAFDPRTKEN
jgi:HlyD family secretion protein